MELIVGVPKSLVSSGKFQYLDFFLPRSCLCMALISIMTLGKDLTRLFRILLDKNRLHILKIEHECHNEKSPVAK
jgi:hypothetical protein